MDPQRYDDIVEEELQRRFLRPGLGTRTVAEAHEEVHEEGTAARALYKRFRTAELSQHDKATNRQAQPLRPKREIPDWLSVSIVILALLLALLMASLLGYLQVVSKPAF